VATDGAGSSECQKQSNCRPRTVGRAPARTIVPVERSDVVLGPLFTLGAVLVAVGLRRRSPSLAAVGALAIVADQRLPLAQRLKDALLPE
jgi:hypothetical protein